MCTHVCTSFEFVHSRFRLIGRGCRHIFPTKIFRLFRIRGVGLGDLLGLYLRNISNENLGIAKVIGILLGN